MSPIVGKLMLDLGNDQLISITWNGKLEHSINTIVFVKNEVIGIKHTKNTAVPIIIIQVKKKN